MPVKPIKTFVIEGLMSRSTGKFALCFLFCALGACGSNNTNCGDTSYAPVPTSVLVGNRTPSAQISPEVELLAKECLMRNPVEPSLVTGLNPVLNTTYSIDGNYYLRFGYDEVPTIDVAVEYSRAAGVVALRIVE